MRAAAVLEHLINPALLQRMRRTVRPAVMMILMDEAPDEFARVFEAEHTRGRQIAECANPVDVQSIDTFGGRIQEKQVLLLALP